jgi:predicted transcriptional regulator YdeE
MTTQWAVRINDQNSASYYIGSKVRSQLKNQHEYMNTQTHRYNAFTQKKNNDKNKHNRILVFMCFVCVPG